MKKRELMFILVIILMTNCVFAETMTNYELYIKYLEKYDVYLNQLPNSQDKDIQDLIKFHREEIEAFYKQKQTEKPPLFKPPLEQKVSSPSKDLFSSRSPTASLETLGPYTYTFSIPEIIQDNYYQGHTFDRIMTSDMYNLGDTVWGTPSVPFKIVHLLLPQMTNLPYGDNSIQVTLSEPYTINLTNPLLPRHHSLRIREGGEYEPSEWFPYQVYNYRYHTDAQVHKCRGYLILSFRLYPIQYKAATNEVVIYRRAEVSVAIQDTSQVEPFFRNLTKDAEWIKISVDNPQVLDTSYTIPNPPPQQQTPLVNPDDSFDYVIITDQNQVGSFSSFASWKRQKGTSCQIVTVQDIGLYYTGADLQEKIRNFIKDAYLCWETEYVLLGGDAEWIPKRGFWLYNTNNFYDQFPNYEYDEALDAASDLYYSNLDGTWNDDHDSKWAEVGEDDFYAEVFLGRAPVDQTNEIQNFCSKTMAYVDMAPSAYLYKILLSGHFLWGQYYRYPSQAYYQNMCIPEDGGTYLNNLIPFIPSYYTYGTLYELELDYWWNYLDIMPLMEAGLDFISDMGHACTYSAMGMLTSNLPNLQNDYNFLAFEDGCYTAYFDWNGWYQGWNDTIGEEFVTHPRAAFAWIGNTSLGMGSPGTADCGGSIDLNKGFARTVFQENIPEIGKALQHAKENMTGTLYDLVNGQKESNINRWVNLDVVLLGDPQVQIHIKSLKLKANTQYPTLE